MPDTPRSGPTHGADDLTLEQMLETAFRRDDRWESGTATRAVVEPVPERLGRYTVLEPIGSGGVGHVYRVRDEELGRTIALKVLKHEFATDPASVARFTEEGQLLGQLAHPGIVPLHEAGILEDGRPFFTMRLVEGKTFAEILRRRASAAADRPHALHVLRSTCEALGYAHSLGIVHGDVKPGNVMVGAFGEVQLMDFGFARRSSGAAACAGARRPSAGTPAYMAPEQARSEGGSISERTDVFGVGGILCEILTGEPPYGGSTRESVIGHAAGADLAPTHARIRAAGADEALATLTIACLTADPAARPANASEVAARIAEWQDGVEARARSADVAAAEARARLEQTRRSQRLAIALVSAIALAIVAVVTILANTEHQRLVRRTATTAAVNAAMAEAKGLELQALEHADHPGNEQDAEAERCLRDALAATARAEALARTADADEASLASALAAKAALELRARNAGKVRTLRNRLAGLRHDVGDGRTVAELESGYAAAFGEFGATESTPPSEAARVLRSLEAPEDRALAIEALDDWCVLRRQSGSPEKDSWLQTLEVLRAFDGDPWRAALRDAWAAGDVARLETLAREPIDEQRTAFSLCLLGRQLRAAGRAQAALDFYRRACRARPESARLCHDHAMLVATTGAKPDPAASVRLLWMATASDPHDGHLLVDLGLALLETGDHDSAREVLERAVRTGPGDARGWYVLALARRKGGAPADEVRRTLAESTRLGSMPARLVLGDVLQAEGRIAEAIRTIEPLVARDPRDAMAHRTLALLYQKTGEIARAKRLAAPFASQPCESAMMAFGLGWIALDSGEFREAADLFTKAADLAREREPDLEPRMTGWAQRASDAVQIVPRLTAIADDSELPPSRARLRGIAFVARRASRPVLSARAYERLASDAAAAQELDGEDLLDAAVAAMQAARQRPREAEAWTRRAVAWLGDLVTSMETFPADDPGAVSFTRSLWHGITLTPALAPLWERAPESRASSADTRSDLARRVEALGKTLGVR